MKKRMLVLLCMGLSLFLVACSGNAKLSMNEVVSKTVKNREKVDSYRMIRFSENSDPNGKLESQSTMKSKEIFNSDKELEKGDSSTQGANRKGYHNDRVIMPGGEEKFVFTEKNGGEFTKKKVRPNESYFINPNYFKILDTLLKVKDEFSMEETESYYIFTNKDDKFDLFEKFGDQFGLKITSGKKESFISKVKIFIDKSDFRIISFEFELTTNVNKFKMMTKTEFMDFNKIKSEEIKEPDVK